MQEPKIRKTNSFNYSKDFKFGYNYISFHHLSLLALIYYKDLGYSLATRIEKSCRDLSLLLAYKKLDFSPESTYLKN